MKLLVVVTAGVYLLAKILMQGHRTALPLMGTPVDPQTAAELWAAVTLIVTFLLQRFAPGLWEKIKPFIPATKADVDRLKS